MAQTNDGRDAYDRHAEFRHEKQHLAAVVDSIDAEIQHRESLGLPYAGDTDAAREVKDLQGKKLAEARADRNRPYFGRIDYSTGEGEDVRSIYIGYRSRKYKPPQCSIVDRNSPIARLYYSPAEGFFYDPSGMKRLARVELTRALTIDNARLLDVHDVWRLPGASDAPVTTSSAVLDRKLSRASDEQLSDVVQTIQPEQYEQIASTRTPVLIVQGAAGSGKSLIGLHRIDFILSPYSDIGSLRRPTAERVIMFGPSPAFLEYVSDLLPGLGIERVRQTTVTDWLLTQFSSWVRLASGDRVFSDLMNNRRQLTEAEVEAHVFKGELTMKRLVDNYVSQFRGDIQRRVGRSTGLRIPGGPPLELSAAVLKSEVTAALEAYPEPNAARRYLVNNLTDEWVRTQRKRHTLRSAMVVRGRGLVERHLIFWPRVDFRTAYTNLVSDPDEIMKYARRGDVDSTGATEISRTAPAGAGQALGVTDLAAALYLDYAVNGFESERFEHIVVDEAQDVSPLEIELLRMHSTNDSFTILGDLRQSIRPYKAIRNWDQLARLFQRGRVSRLDSRSTYRSTRQITQYANRILQGLPARTRMPIAYHRRGERPRLVRSGSAAEMRRSIADAVQRLRRLDNVRSIAILTKWRQTARDISEALRVQGIEGVGMLTEGGLIDTDVTVSPIILTQGLEFDTVIVANAHRGNLNESEFDRMLLYLACTRAKHYLEIHWYGARSPIVPDVARLAL